MGDVREVRPPTIHDVAKRAGVAASTVSRALSRPDRVNAKTRSRILEVAREMGFRPSPIARALPSGRTMTLGLLVPDITNPFFLDLIRGAERRATKAGYVLVLADANESPEDEATLLERLIGSVDGVVLISSRRSDDDLRAAYERAPLVVVNRRVRPIPGVVIDPVEGARTAARHLADLGHRKVAYLAGPRTSWTNGHRWKALCAEAEQLDLDFVRLETDQPNVEGGGKAAERLVDQLAISQSSGASDSGVTAVLAYNDLVAIGALRQFRSLGIGVPDQVSVIGFDDIFGADFCHPPLTTLAAPIEDAGRTAIELLLDQLGGDAPESKPSESTAANGSESETPQAESEPEPDPRQPGATEPTATEPATEPAASSADEPADQPAVEEAANEIVLQARLVVRDSTCPSKWRSA